ncbi:hypothetical protein CTA1_11299 [Colletotrichum tanaceti]|uniref:Uncharacterized protein n=1 Tax=Colletotrichum tanaceti TaxID=1306861 RepID=A0A4U6XMH1_9PEZI|nr:hypothetical protein CTA1_11299 [Colletotrichum tanaceti]
METAVANPGPSPSAGMIFMSLGRGAFFACLRSSPLITSKRSAMLLLLLLLLLLGNDPYQGLR